MSEEPTLEEALGLFRAREKGKGLGSLWAELKEREGSKFSPEEIAGLLSKRYEAFKKGYDFKPGSLVTWKKGFKNRRRPREGEPAIVIAVLTESVFADDDEAGTPYFREPLNIALGVLNP